jgi:hypothetical protein
MFHALDVDKNGMVSRKEFMVGVHFPEVSEILEEVGLDVSDAADLFDVRFSYQKLRSVIP